MKLPTFMAPPVPDTNSGAGSCELTPGEAWHGQEASSPGGKSGKARKRPRVYTGELLSLAPPIVREASLASHESVPACALLCLCLSPGEDKCLLPAACCGGPCHPPPSSLLPPNCTS